VWHMELQPATFARGAALGFVLPLVATAWPVWRAVRVMPVDAIATTHRTARGGLAPLLRRLPWPASAFRRMPVGNVLRAPRRTLLTALGIGAAITTLVALLGMIDSFAGTMDRNERELLQAHPDRVSVSLDGFLPADGDEVSAVAASLSVGEVAPVVRLGARLRGPAGAEVDVVLEALDLEGQVWSPTVVEGDRRGEGLVVARKAADDLGVRVGDDVLVEHPALRGGRFEVVTTRLPVAAIHPGPLRFNAYLDRSALDAFGAAGLANALYVLPAPGATVDDVSAALFGARGVASVQPVAVAAGLMSDMLDELATVFQALQAFVLLLALLIAYNATSINADERARERATLFAFGLPVRRVLGLEAAEGLLVGLLGTAAGVTAGLLVLHWMSTSLLDTSMPDLQLDVALSPVTLVTAATVGVLAVTVAPLLTARRLRRMDIPGTLRVVE
jgi:putative ABC transport system permease protein